MLRARLWLNTALQSQVYRFTTTFTKQSKLVTPTKQHTPHLQSFIR